MALPRARQLLAQLDDGHHRERARAMALLGRDNRDDPELGPLLDSLAAESGYHHHLALIAAAAAGDQERLRGALTDPSPRVRSFALANMGRLGLTPDAVRQALLSGSADDRRRLHRFVTSNGRTDIAEAVIDDVRRELGDREAAALLTTCGDATVRRLLPELLYAVPRLVPLARHHPQALLDHLEAELREVPQRRRDLLWNRFYAALPDLGLIDPGRVLGLVEDLGPSRVLPTGLLPILGHLIRFAPARVAALLADDEFVGSIGWQLPEGLRKNAHRFSPADRVRVATALRERMDLVFAFISRLPPSERAGVFEAAVAGLDTSTTTWPFHQLELLPRAVRHAEARRILDLRVIRDDVGATLMYTAVLPFAEARPVLGAELRRAKPEDRARGYRLLFDCARRERTASALGSALELALRLQNDQDPVRLAAFQALAEVSPLQVTDQHLDDLGVLVKAAAEARDTSPATIHALVTFALRLLAASDDPASPRSRFALQLIRDMAGQAGWVSFPQLDQLLPLSADAALVDALLAQLQLAAARGEYRLALSLAQSLGRRAWRHAGLQAVLGQATAAADDWIVQTAIGLWLADPRPRDARVDQLVAHDESTVTVGRVRAIIENARQDLLDVLLRPQPLQGRFLEGDVRYVPVGLRGFHRWLPRQCAAYREALEQLIATPGTDVWTVTMAVRTLARLPEIGAAAIRPYVGASDVSVQEAALSGLAWTDRPSDTLDELLTYAGGDRARVAVYAATRCARFVPRAQLAPPLFGVLARDDAKVTARKEVVRLLAAHRPPGWLDALVDLGARDDTHRDVRLAVGRSLRGALDDDRVWSLLARLASGSDDEAQSLLETQPTQIAPRHRPRYAGLVLDIARSGGPGPSWQACTFLGAWAPWAGAAPGVAAAIVEDLASGRRWHPALAALGQMLRDGVGWDEVDRLVVTLAGRTDAPDLDAGPERDRPSLQRLVALVRRVSELTVHERATYRTSVLQEADRLATAGSLSSEELVVRFAGLDWSSPTDGFTALVPHLDAHPILTGPALADLAKSLDRDQTMWSAPTLAPAVDHLSAQPSPGAGALAVGLVQAVGARYSWPEEWRARLRALRSHPDADVAALARAVPTASE